VPGYSNKNQENTMSHHGNPPHNPHLSEMMQRLMGEYPNGRLNGDDAGALAMAVGINNGKVVLQFPKPVSWIGMTPDETIGLAELLVKRARESGATKPLTVTIGG
jgi:hypothetical protein